MNKIAISVLFFIVLMLFFFFTAEATNVTAELVAIFKFGVKFILPVIALFWFIRLVKNFEKK